MNFFKFTTGDPDEDEGEEEKERGLMNSQN